MDWKQLQKRKGEKHMLLDSKKYQEFMAEKGLTEEEVSKRTGLTLKSVKWILKTGRASVDALERLASVLEVPVNEIVKEEPLGFNENVIEFLKDGKTATLSLSQGRYKTRIRELTQSHPEECEIVAENKDGSMCAHVPVDWIRINPSLNLTEEQRKKCAERARNNFRKD